MRLVLLPYLLVVGSCGPGLVYRPAPVWNADEMVARASDVFVGVIEKQEFHPWMRPSGMEKYWWYLRRQVRVEVVLKGSLAPGVLDVWEVHWVGGTTGDWNSTRERERALFLVTVENGRYRLIYDWDRNIFPVTSGAHTRAPLTEAAPLWERVALLNWWFAGKRSGGADLFHADPGGKLGLWRQIKLARGLVRHPVSGVRMEGCRFLLDSGWGLDECWERLTEVDRSHMRDHGSTCCTEAAVVALRKRTAEMVVAKEWAGRLDRDYRRLFTTVNHPQKRAEFCRLYLVEYPGDADHGCPADRAAPATIVTEIGDIPLVEDWPR